MLDPRDPQWNTGGAEESARKRPGHLAARAQGGEEQTEHQRGGRHQREQRDGITRVQPLAQARRVNFSW